MATFITVNVAATLNTLQLRNHYIGPANLCYMLFTATTLMSNMPVIHINTLKQKLHKSDYLPNPT